MPASEGEPLAPVESVSPALGGGGVAGAKGLVGQLSISGELFVDGTGLLPFGPDGMQKRLLPLVGPLDGGSELGSFLQPGDSFGTFDAQVPGRIAPPPAALDAKTGAVDAADGPRTSAVVPVAGAAPPDDPAVPADGVPVVPPQGFGGDGRVGPAGVGAAALLAAAAALALEPPTAGREPCRNCPRIPKLTVA